MSSRASMSTYCLFAVALWVTFTLAIPDQEVNSALVPRGRMKDIITGKKPLALSSFHKEEPQPDEASLFGSDQSNKVGTGFKPPYALSENDWASDQLTEIYEDEMTDDSGDESATFALNQYRDRVYRLKYTDAALPEMGTNLEIERTVHPYKRGMVFSRITHDSSNSPSVAVIRDHIMATEPIKMLKVGESFPFILDQTNSYSISRTNALGRGSNVRIYVKKGTETEFDRKWLALSQGSAGITEDPGLTVKPSIVEEIKHMIINADREPEEIGVSRKWDNGMLEESFDDKAYGLSKYHHWNPEMLWKRNVMNNLEGASSSQPANDYQTFYRDSLSAFESIRGRAMEIIFPYIKELVNGTRNNMVWDAAWSIYSELTMAPVQVIGPFTMGLGCMDWFEEKLFNGTNSTINSLMAKKKLTAEEVVKMKAIVVGWELQQAYEITYDTALAALNSSGVLSDMVTLASYLKPKNTSIIPEYMKIPVVDPNTAFFTQYRNTT